MRKVFEEVREEEEGFVNWKVVDAGKRVEQVSDEVWDIVSEVLEGERGELKMYTVGWREGVVESPSESESESESESR